MYITIAKLRQQRWGTKHAVLSRKVVRRRVSSMGAERLHCTTHLVLRAALPNHTGQSASQVVRVEESGKLCAPSASLMRR